MKSWSRNMLGAAALGQRFDPLILRAETVVDVSSNAQPNNNALINPSGEAWEIHEIKFGVQRETVLSEARCTGAALDVSLSWLGQPITDGFVPVWNCAPLQAVEEFRALQQTSDNTGTTGYWSAQDAFYSWKLDHPLYIPPMQALAVEFRNNGLANFPIRASISLIGRVMPRSAQPSRAKVPYVSAFKSRFYDFGETGLQQSLETTLLNQFKTDLTIERFVGRMTSRVQLENDPAVYVDQISRFAFRGSLFEATHRVTTGDIVARNFTKFGDLYGWQNMKWAVRHTLEPNQGHVITIRKNAPGSLPAPNVINAAAQAVVSMVGWREEQIP